MVRVRLVITLLGLTLLGVAAAQEKEKGKEKKAEDPPMKLRGQLPANFKKLGLTDDQVQKVYKVGNDYKAKIDDLQKQIVKLKAERKEAEEKVLTKEQLKRLREIRAGEKGGDK